MITEHYDEYDQRYITTITPVLLGTEITTEIYTPYIYGQETITRETKDSIEVYGIITIITQVYNKQNQLIAQGTTSQTDWIEIWKKCWQKPKGNFKYNFNQPLTEQTQSQITTGPSYTTPNSPNNVIWPNIDPLGNPLPPGTGQTNLQFINIWN